ncbi:MAG: hypothetical protein P8L32_02875, partial [Paracoccaceae bacterium]|nr:hypothetical protein [Paracoccaceae bacterium]
ICLPLLKWPTILNHQRESLTKTVIVISAGMFAINALLEPIAEAVIGLDGDDLYNFMGFLMGIWIGANAARALEWMARWWWVLLLSGTASYPLTLTFQLAYYEIIENYSSWSGLYGEFEYVMWHGVRPVNGLIWGMGLFGLASRYLNKPSRYLARLNALVFPLYVFHMPIVLIGIGIAAKYQVAWELELLLIIVVSFALSVMLAIGAERLGKGAYLFGATPRHR